MTIKTSVFFIVLITFFTWFSVGYTASWVKIVTGVNPHDQINDEGEILYEKCLFCHYSVPDIERAKSIDDVTFRFEKHEDLKDICYRCHQERMHPGGAFGAGWMKGGEKNVNWAKYGAPYHWVKPPKVIAERIKKQLEKYPTILPFDPITEKITCPTCHNPHERGLLPGKAGTGADNDRRLRWFGLAICQMCHEK